ncbi:hypothetical protein D3C84_1246050 [compost metagenome]
MRQAGVEAAGYRVFGNAEPGNESPDLEVRRSSLRVPADDAHTELVHEGKIRLESQHLFR